MSMTFADAIGAINDAKRTMGRADQMANDMANLLSQEGRLRRVGNGFALARLKKELKNFDSRDHKWIVP